MIGRYAAWYTAHVTDALKGNTHLREWTFNVVLSWSDIGVVRGDIYKNSKNLRGTPGVIGRYAAWYTAQVNDILQCTKLPILVVSFQENCKYSEHVCVKLIKPNKCLFVLRPLRKEGFSQGEVDHLFSTLVLPHFTYGLPVYGAVDSDLMVIHNFMDRCFKKEIHI